MAEPNINMSDGEYYIYPASSTSRVLDVAGSRLTTPDANVQLWQLLNDNAQVWQVVFKNSDSLPDGEWYVSITSRLFGKRLGPKTSSSSTAVLDPSNLGNRAIRLRIKDAGSRATINGKQYSTYNIIYEAVQDLYLKANGTANGSDVVFTTDSTSSTSIRWAFVPIDQVDDKGLYEIRSKVDPKYALDVTNHGTINGSNIQIYPGTGLNNQKFVIEKRDADSYAIRAVGSGKYVDVDSAIAANRQNVAIWEDNNTRAQRWKIYEYGETKHDGLTCKIVSFGSYVTKNADQYFMDVHAGNAAPFENVRIFERTETDAQRFLLQPTTAEDTNMPTPYSLGVAAKQGATLKTYGYTQDGLVLGWRCSAAWCSENGINSYEIRYRTRTMNSKTSSWRAWSSWSAWTIEPVSQSGTSVWAKGERIADEYAWSNSKNQQIELQVRSVGADGLELLHSAATDQVINIYRKPNVTIDTTLGWTPAGLSMAWHTDYLYGTTYLYIDAITKNGKNILSEPIELSTTDKDNTCIIDRDKITEWVEDDTRITIRYRIGYDQQTICDDTTTSSVKVSYDAGNVSVVPILTLKGPHMYAHVPDFSEVRMWIQYHDKLLECPQVGRGNRLDSFGTETESERVQTYDLVIPTTYTSFELLYPTNDAEFLIYTEARSGAAWGTDISKAHHLYTSYAWTVGTETIFLRYFMDAPGVYEHSHDATYQTDILDAREHASVSFAKTKTDTLQAYGVIMHNGVLEDECDVLDFEHLVGKHTIFRDVVGGIHHAAVTNVSITSHKDYDEVSVQMIEETI